MSYLEFESWPHVYTTAPSGYDNTADNGGKIYRNIIEQIKQILRQLKEGWARQGD